MCKKQILRMITFCILAAVLVVFLSNFLVLNSTHDRLRVHGFYLEPKNSIDVALIGASEFYRGYYAPLAYQEKGFTSYALSIASMPASLYLPALKEYRKYQSPKLFVFEINGVYYEDQVQESSIRKWFDNLPFSLDKLGYIEEVVPREEQDSYYIKLKKYHTNWKHLATCMEVFREKQTMNRNGYSYTKNICVSTKTYKKPAEIKKEKREISKAGEKYLRELLQYCKDEKLENVLFVRWPHQNKFEIPASYEKVIGIIEEYGYRFVNFSEHAQEMGLDWEQDFKDAEHLNIFGMEKMTKYFAEYITQRYDVVSEHSAKVKEEWEACVAFMDYVIPPCKEETLKGIKKSYTTESDFLNNKKKEKREAIKKAEGRKPKDNWRMESGQAPF